MTIRSCILAWHVESWERLTQPGQVYQGSPVALGQQRQWWGKVWGAQGCRRFFHFNCKKNLRINLERLTGGKCKRKHLAICFFKPEKKKWRKKHCVKENSRGEAYTLPILFVPVETGKLGLCVLCNFPCLGSGHLFSSITNFPRWLQLNPF